MLVLKVTMLEGRTPTQKAALIHQLSIAAAQHLNQPLADVRVVIYEVPKHAWGSGGRSIAEREEENR
jgi:4-oxalocrotonate tautomerase